jgi:hypothetical protein
MAEVPALEENSSRAEDSIRAQQLKIFEILAFQN